MRKMFHNIFLFFYNTDTMLEIVSYYRDVPPDNNFAERQIRCAVVMRKNSYCNRSEQGAQTQAILMSIFKTLQQRKYIVTNEMVNALKHFVKTKKLPPLPKKRQTCEQIQTFYCNITVTEGDVSQMRW